MSKKFFSTFLFLNTLLFSLPLITKAQSVDDTLNGLNNTAGKVPAFQGQTSATYDSGYFATRAGSIIGVILSFVGVLFLGLMIYAGIMWMTASGNEQQVTKAKNLLINATIGIVIVFAAYAITAFIGNNFIK